jgi:hypothetical protein
LKNIFKNHRIESQEDLKHCEAQTHPTKPPYKSKHRLHLGFQHWPSSTCITNK